MAAEFSSHKKLDNLIEFKLDEDIFTNNINYYFTDLDGKYEYTNTIMPGLLEIEFKRKFEPIYILSSIPNKYYKKRNYVILNSDLKKSRNIHTIELLDSEELNEEFSKSTFIKELINKLDKKQDTIFIYNFTSSFLSIKHPKITIIGPNPKIATKYDSKYNHYKLFKKLGIPTVRFEFCKDINAITKHNKINYPLYFFSNYSSGGLESRIIYNTEELVLFHSNLQIINRKGPFIVSEYHRNVQVSPNVNAIIVNKKVHVLNITDQILNGHKYLGNIYPSKISVDQKKTIVNYVTKIGKNLADEGFEGLFGCDFIIDNGGSIYIVDLNPRRQGGYITLCLINKRLIEIELQIALDPKLNSAIDLNFDCDFVWAHSKLAVKSDGVNKITKAFRINTEESPFKKIGSEFMTSFYPIDYSINIGSIGYYLTTGKDYELVFKKLQKKTTMLTNKILN